MMLRCMMTVSFGMLATATAFAQGGDRWECTMGGLLRRVEIFYEPGGLVPCEVHYIKETEAPDSERQVLWRAENEAGYCEARMREFVQRLQSLGWQCDASSAPASAQPTSSTATEDDTAVLGASDE